MFTGEDTFDCDSEAAVDSEANRKETGQDDRTVG